MATHLEEKPLTHKDAVDRRRSKRLTLSFKVEVIGFDRDGRMFQEQAVTSDVSEHGCRFDLLRELDPGQVLLIRLAERPGKNSEERTPMAYEVAWIIPSTHGWSIGAAKLQTANMFHMGFPSKKPAATPDR